MDDVPEKYRVLYHKAMKGTASPRQAIKSFCQRCVCYENAPEEIRGCSDVNCPLWAYRPYQDGIREPTESVQTAEREG